MINTLFTYSTFLPFRILGHFARWKTLERFSSARRKSLASGVPKLECSKPAEFGSTAPVPARFFPGSAEV